MASEHMAYIILIYIVHIYYIVYIIIYKLLYYKSLGVMGKKNYRGDREKRPPKLGLRVTEKKKKV